MARSNTAGGNLRSPNHMSNIETWELPSDTIGMFMNHVKNTREKGKMNGGHDISSEGQQMSIFVKGKCASLCEGEMHVKE